MGEPPGAHLRMSFNHASDRFYPFVRRAAKAENCWLLSSSGKDTDHAGRVDS
ncbi:MULTISPECIES: hypothetical protein [Pseudomonas]|uniref:hypothetical protein n=1 Tax=Pseudomonas TaxID=286 RepID=UPI00135CA44D|nr:MULTISPECIES: hypothetical protein [Pseudomonas]MCU1725025.1 hypothetical protein [Pseudomonas sp. 5P_5.1_Bac1]MCU1730652.1 hypothetical protein [Pseudomonas sp. 20P_3.2_Bac4]MCU1742191.1 hypothetical protein [Pseudomonas sp. 20P_3.2_Bac5]